MRHSKFSRMPWKPSPLNTLLPNMNNSCKIRFTSCLLLVIKLYIRSLRFISKISPFLQIEPEILLIPLLSFWPIFFFFFLKIIYSQTSR
ncbi:hypothetical protein MTR67_003933 [Solanum verrucosum]|uniref:Uncharacterized protein n=1 Tax=Solanum verrucosum TaxID=315347 RepID=A0AAF0PTG2_SOLVR|nr:hypothetical protein MTR67_003933 [Solanum verrucosum]